MKELWKNEYKNILLVIAYTIVALVVYCVWFQSIWHRWYITLLTGFVVAILGCVVGYFYIKSDIKAKIKNNEIKEEKNQSVEEEKTENNNEEKQD